ncbi:unnamed protein product [Plutella xylostella]|uniref:(diamondback moth) hypothetical protein n=1 Tax=Plutella xylostella TaxID=51655 RepID=A0A8S4G9C9_PLUXY|nr:unnamed protein product [Plutella xylostella]
MEEVAAVLKQIKQDLSEQKQEMREMRDSIIQSLNENINEKFQKMDLRQTQLEQKVESQEKNITFLEKKIRMKNLIIFGVPETEKSYNDLESIVLQIINGKVKIGNCSSSDLENVHRVGKKGDKVRPILTTFSTMGMKIAVLKNKKLLDGTDYYIKEDFPKKVLEKRKELQDQLEKLKTQGKRAFLKYDTIVIIPEKNNQQNNNPQERRERKRNKSSSPKVPSVTICRETQSTPDTNNTIQPAKKNKYDIKRFLQEPPKTNTEY